MKHAYYGVIFLAFFFALYNLLAGIWGFGVIIGQSGASDSCSPSTYWYLVVRTIVALIFGIWVLLIRWRDWTWDPRLDIVAFFALLIIFGLWIWEAVNLGIDSVCTSEMESLWGWVYYTAATIFFLDLVAVFFLTILICCLISLDYDDEETYYSHRDNYHYISEPHRSPDAHISHPVKAFFNGMFKRSIGGHEPFTKAQERKYMRTRLELKTKK